MSKEQEFNRALLMLNMFLHDVKTLTDDEIIEYYTEISYSLGGEKPTIDLMLMVKNYREVMENEHVFTR